MKKILKCLCGLLLSTLAVSCASTKIAATDIESEVFQITEISVNLGFLDFGYTTEEIYGSIDFETIENEFATKYGFELRHDLFTEDDYKNLVMEHIHIDKKDSPTNKEIDFDYLKIEKEHEANQYVSITQGYYESFNGYPGWSATVNLPNGKKFSFGGSNKYWANKYIVVDEDNAAFVTLKKNLQLHRINGENFYAYENDNLKKSDDGKSTSYLIPTDEPVKISYSVVDPGNMFIAGGEWYNQTEEFTFEKGKKYEIGYKIDRNHFLAANWTVALEIKELE